MLGGAIAVVIGIVFGVFQFMGRNIAGGFMSIGGGLFAGIVIGFAPQWVSSLTGQTISHGRHARCKRWWPNHAYDQARRAVTDQSGTQ